MKNFKVFYKAKVVYSLSFKTKKEMKNWLKKTEYSDKRNFYRKDMKLETEKGKWSDGQIEFFDYREMD